ncbi:MAG TPA: arsenate reductase ArsC [Rubricoccaceae bacterium]|nr:arsenate reductase ArsC [Rubricoccaceae bacterium]
MKTRVLFACVENANRSQMAEAFARMHGADVLEPLSAGSEGSGQVNPKAVAAMAEKGYDLTTHRPKTLDEVEGPFDYVITMGCGEACPFVAARRREDWALPDPKALPPEAFNAVRDEIERRVLALVAEVGAGR